MTTLATGRDVLSPMSESSRSKSLAHIRQSLVARKIVASTDNTVQKVRLPVFTFTGEESERQGSLAKFERIDDVIMGGISKSQFVDGGDCASWRGIVRTDGGGFCGQRTRPFQSPLNLTGADGIYISCRLASDDDVDRRVWKLSLRTNEGRGEVVYQAPFTPPAGESANPVYVPFSDFVLVRGPIAVPNAPKVSNVSAIYQLGFTVSKFVIGPQMTQLDGFRNGTFQLDVAELGAWTESPAPQWDEMALLNGKAEIGNNARQRRPLVFVLLGPILGLVFSESKRRKRRAALLLKERGASSLDLIRMGWSFKRNLRGKSLAGSLLQSVREGILASIGFVLGGAARLTLFPILRQQAKRERQRQERLLKAQADDASSQERLR